MFRQAQDDDKGVNWELGIRNCGDCLPPVVERLTLNNEFGNIWAQPESMMRSESKLGNK